MSSTAAFWNNLAEEYAAKPVELPEAFENKIAVTQAAMKPTDVVLDVGCGTGSLALRLAPGAAQVHALDIASEMLRIGRSKAEAAGVDNVTFHEGTLADVPFEPGSLDGICAYSILHLLEDRDDALARMFALLKPGGFLIASTVCLGGTWMPWAPLLAVLRWAGKAPMVKVISKDAIVADMQRAGFVDIQQPDVGAKPRTSFTVARKPS